MDSGLQRKLGQAMGADFSGVKVHTDNQADQLSRSIQAKAFTTGQDVFFRHGAYQPGSRRGQELIAHELTHVVQQNPQQITEKNEGCVFAKSKSDIPRNNLGIYQNLESKVEPSANRCIQRKFEAVGNFHGHSNNQFGINDEVKLSVNNVMAKQYLGRLEWRLIMGDGTLNPTKSDGSATFIAGDTPGSVVLNCYVKYIDQKVDSANFTTVKPSGRYRGLD
ncbi:MAG: DUF4157 domain-containing protein [Kovacikia sp.]